MINNDSLSISEVAGVFEEEPAFRRFAWPPRSYSCSFCRREFRSAQALGGHMNVHRRDRARLKHQPSPPPPPPPHELQAAAGETAGILHHHHHHQKHAFYKKRADGEKSVEKRDSLSAGIIGLVDGTAGTAAAVVCKRNKQSPLMAAPLFLHSKLVSSTHEIDLELRLGLGFHIHG